MAHDDDHDHVHDENCDHEHGDDEFAEELDEFLGEFQELLGTDPEAAMELVESLDEKDDLDSGFDVSEFQDLIVKSAEAALAGLPSPYLERLKDVPVLLEPRPSRVLVKDGFDPRALARFEGPTLEAQAGGTLIPTKIILYTANLPAEFEDEEELASEIEITLLNEIGSYYSLSEEELDRLGLE